MALFIYGGLNSNPNDGNSRTSNPFFLHNNNLKFSKPKLEPVTITAISSKVMETSRTEKPQKPMVQTSCLQTTMDLLFFCWKIARHLSRQRLSFSIVFSKISVTLFFFLMLSCSQFLFQNLRCYCLFMHFLSVIGFEVFARFVCSKILSSVFMILKPFCI